jgi:hypothetical protein
MLNRMQANIYLEDLPRADDKALQILQEITRKGAEFSEFGPGSEYDVVHRYFKGLNRDYFPFLLHDGKYALSVLEQTPAILLEVDLDYADPAENREVASQALQLLEDLLPLCDLRFASADLQGGNLPPSSELLAGGLPWLFWANFYGPAAVERWGRDFLLGAPGWKKDELPGGIIEYVLTPEPHAPVDPELAKEIQSYFAPRFRIERYRPTPIL